MSAHIRLLSIDCLTVHKAVPGSRAIPASAPQQQGSHPAIGKQLQQYRMINPAINNMHTGHAAF